MSALGKKSSSSSSYNSVRSTLSSSLSVATRQPTSGNNEASASVSALVPLQDPRFVDPTGRADAPQSHDDGIQVSMQGGIHFDSSQFECSHDLNRNLNAQVADQAWMQRRGKMNKRPKRSSIGTPCNGSKFSGGTRSRNRRRNRRRRNGRGGRYRGRGGRGCFFTGQPKGGHTVTDLQSTGNPTGITVSSENQSGFPYQDGEASRDELFRTARSRSPSPGQSRGGQGKKLFAFQASRPKSSCQPDQGQS